MGTSFLGRYEHAVDAKGRLALPARFRDGVGPGSVLTRGSEHCLVIYPGGAWSALRTNVSSLPISDPNARAFRRFLFAEASDVELDGQGRILLSANQRSFAGIDRSAVIVGMDGTIEVWSAERWSRIELELHERSHALLDQLQSLI